MVCFSFNFFLNFILQCESVCAWCVCLCICMSVFVCVEFRGELCGISSFLPHLLRFWAQQVLHRLDHLDSPSSCPVYSVPLSRQAYRIRRISLWKHNSVLLMRVELCTLQHNLIPCKFTPVTHTHAHTQMKLAVTPCLSPYFLCPWICLHDPSSCDRSV